MYKIRMLARRVPYLFHPTRWPLFWGLQYIQNAHVRIKQNKNKK